MAESMPFAALADAPLVEAACLGDVLEIVDLIVEASLLGVLKPQFQSRSVQAGLVWQLVLVCLLGRLFAQGVPSRRARLQVVRQPGGLGGFALLVAMGQGPDQPSHRIALCAVRASARGQGLGRLLVAQLLQALPPGAVVDAECLPRAVAMQKVFQRLGFIRIAVPGQLATRWVWHAACGTPQALLSQACQARSVVQAGPGTLIRARR